VSGRSNIPASDPPLRQYLERVLLAERHDCEDLVDESKGTASWNRSDIELTKIFRGFFHLIGCSSRSSWQRTSVKARDFP